MGRRQVATGGKQRCTAGTVASGNEAHAPLVAANVLGKIHWYDCIPLLRHTVCLLLQLKAPGSLLLLRSNSCTIHPAGPVNRLHTTHCSDKSLVVHAWKDLSRSPVAPAEDHSRPDGTLDMASAGSRSSR